MVDIVKLKFINGYNPKKGGTLNEAVKHWPMRTWNGYVVLEHDSNTRIKNGVIDHTGQQQNGHSKNSDLGNYFWASEPGKDQSNGGTYKYYCLVKPELIYNIDDDPNGYGSTPEALEHEQYVAGQWKDGAVAVMTLQPTPISFIYAGGDFGDVGGIYDGKWHMLRSTGVYYDKRKNMALARKIKPYQNVDVPDFLGGYTYNQLISAPGY